MERELTLTASAATDRRTEASERAIAGAVKRLIDIVVAIVVLVCLIPVFLVLAVLIVLESPGPVFYRAQRVGYRGRPLHMLKLRKMAVGAAGPALTTGGDVRLTRVGAFMHRWRLDELPQFWHVLRGDMSLVGPRPEAPEFVMLHLDEYVDILRVRPGLTGWTQLGFADEPSMLPAEHPERHYIERILPQKVGLDRLYAAAPSLSRDMTILLWTVLAMALRRPVAVNRATGALTVRHPRGSRFERPARTPVLEQLVLAAEDLGDGVVGEDAPNRVGEQVGY